MWSLIKFSLIMKKLVLLLFMFVSVSASAQRIDKPGEPYYAYCQFQLSSNLVSIILAKDTKPEVLYDENGKILKISRMEAMNYVSKRGWEFVFVIDEDRHLYLFKKKVKSDKEILEHLNIKPKD